MKNEHRVIAREKKKEEEGGGGEMKNEMVKISAKVQA